MYIKVNQMYLIRYHKMINPQQNDKPGTKMEITNPVLSRGDAKMEIITVSDSKKEIDHREYEGTMRAPGSR